MGNIHLVIFNTVFSLLLCIFETFHYKNFFKSPEVGITVLVWNLWPRGSKCLSITRIGRSVLHIHIFLGHASPLLSSSAPTTDSADPIMRLNSRQREEELELIDQLRKVCTLTFSYTCAVLLLEPITLQSPVCWLTIFNRINKCLLCTVLAIVW